MSLANKPRKPEKKDIKITLTSGGETSLGKVIKTKEQAEFFMKMLKSL